MDRKFGIEIHDKKVRILILFYNDFLEKWNDISDTNNNMYKLCCF